MNSIINPAQPTRISTRVIGDAEESCGFFWSWSVLRSVTHTCRFGLAVAGNQSNGTVVCAAALEACGLGHPPQAPPVLSFCSTLCVLLRCLIKKSLNAHFSPAFYLLFLSSSNCAPYTQTKQSKASIQDALNQPLPPRF